MSGVLPDQALTSSRLLAEIVALTFPLIAVVLASLTFTTMLEKEPQYREKPLKR
jgi:hypothetical protein